MKHVQRHHMYPVTGNYNGCSQYPLSQQSFQRRQDINTSARIKINQREPLKCDVLIPVFSGIKTRRLPQKIHESGFFEVTQTTLFTVYKTDWHNVSRETLTPIPLLKLCQTLFVFINDVS